MFLNDLVGREPGDCLLIAGVLRKQYDNVRALYEERGFREGKRSAEAEWVSALFERGPAW